MGARLRSWMVATVSGQMETPLLVVAGPTASGKTALAMELAEQLGGEIVSCDSVAVYRLMDIGYHCRDFFLAHWDRFRDVPLGELAHSTHLFGAGTYDRETGEHQRVHVTLATGIPEVQVRHANLGYAAPETVDLTTWLADPDALVVPDAGEILYRLR